MNATPNLRNVAILGSTGSIGTAALDVIAHLGAPWKVVALSTHRRVELLTEQVERFRPTFAVITGDEPAPSLRKRMEAAGAKVLTGPDGMVRVAGGEEAGTVLAAIVGAAGLPAVLAAVTAGKRVALANKESLVVAGSVLMPLAKKTGATLLPVDSEHSAIFQAMCCGRRHEVRRVILTASGGPFRNTPAETMARATTADALAHPTWRMGNKITIDSATLFNKAFELIEAHWLFDLPADQLEVAVHPQSIVHSMVEFVDGSVMAQLSPPDMKLPIQYALTWPDRAAGAGPRMDWGKPWQLTFEPPDRAKFPALDLANHVIQGGGTLGAVMNAANEVAVESFLAGNVRFGAISRVVAAVVGAHQPVSSPQLSDFLQADLWARTTAESHLAAERGKPTEP